MNDQRASAILFRDGLADEHEATSLLCVAPLGTWAIHDLASLHAALAAADAARASGQMVVFAIHYEIGGLLESLSEPPSESGQTAASATSALGHVWIFAQGEKLMRAEADAWLLARANNAGNDGPAGCLREPPALDAVAYTAQIERIRAAIADGDVYQVNVTFPLPVTLYGDPARVFYQLAQAQPTAHAAYIDLPGCHALSLSPELFFAVDGEHITVRPMKGTAARLPDPTADQAQAAALRDSPKNRAENLMIVDLLRNDLGRVAQPGSVQVEKLFTVESFPTVHQMTSTISARLRTQRLQDLIPALFPCGSVTGAPKIAAMQKIARSETTPRGLYTGSIGWASATQIQANVVIRTLILDPGPVVAVARHGTLGVGSGIVWDSDPAAEYAECLLKSDFLLRPDPGFTLFETLRLELPPDDVSHALPLAALYPYYRRHAARLAASSAALGFRFDAAGFEACLWRVKAEIPAAKTPRVASGGMKKTRRFRVRIDLSPAGHWTTSWAALPPVADRVALIWASQRLASNDPLLRHKTSARALYDVAIANAVAGQAFDSLFCNERGEVCEGARSNVFVREGPRLLTPPLRCGLLPGVLRGALLDNGDVCEALLSVADIKAASREGRLRVGNALRGLLPAFLKA